MDCACGLNPVENQTDPVIHADRFRTYEGKRNCADVICDAHHLPFKDGAFQTVFSSHTLEHCDHPMKVLKEFSRVAPNLIIKVPNAGYNREGLNEDDGHLYSWTSKTFTQLLKRIYRDVSLRENVHWKIRGYARVHNIALKQLAIIKTFLFVLALRSRNELEAVCTKPLTEEQEAVKFEDAMFKLMDPEYAPAPEAKRKVKASA